MVRYPREQWKIGCIPENLCGSCQARFVLASLLRDSYFHDVLQSRLRHSTLMPLGVQMRFHSQRETNL